MQFLTTLMNDKFWGLLIEVLMEGPAKRYLVGKTLRVSQKRKSQVIQVKDGSNILDFLEIIIIQMTTIQLRIVLMK